VIDVPTCKKFTPSAATRARIDPLGQAPQPLEARREKLRVLKEQFHIDDSSFVVVGPDELKEVVSRWAAYPYTHDNVVHRWIAEGKLLCKVPGDRPLCLSAL
jgi:hypothetical protein